MKLQIDRTLDNRGVILSLHGRRSIAYVAIGLYWMFSRYWKYWGGLFRREFSVGCFSFGWCHPPLGMSDEQFETEQTEAIFGVVKHAVEEQMKP